MKTWQISLLGIALLFVLGTAIYFGSNKGLTGSSPRQNAAIQETSGQSITDFLQAVVNYSHEGYIADQMTANIDPSDTTSLMAAMIEQIDDENQAVSFLLPYASSSNSSIANASALLAASEVSVVQKQQAALDVMREMSNGVIPTNAQYTIAQVQAAQDERTNNLILASSMLPYLTMDTSSVDASSTATIGPLDPSGALTTDEKTSVNTSLQMDFGDTLNSNQNDIFLLLAQEINLLLISQTYTDFHNVWTNKVSSMSGQ